MKSKPRKSNFQECKIIPITDPAEIAALERRIQAAEKAMAAGEIALATLENGKKPKTRKRK